MTRILTTHLFACRWLIGGLLFALGLVPVAAQKRAGDEPTLQARLAQLEALRRAPESRRIGPVLRLGSFGDREVTAALLTELQSAQGGALRLAVVQSLGQVPRSGLVLRAMADLALESRTQPKLLNAAMRSMVQQGSRGVREVTELVQDRLQGLGGAHRRRIAGAAVRALDVVGTDAAARALALLASTGEARVRMKALEGLRDVGPVPSVDRLRRQILEGDDLELAVEAFRQMARNGARTARVDGQKLMGRMRAPPSAKQRVGMLHGFVFVLEPSVYSAFLDAAASDAGEVQRAVAAVASRAMAHKQFVTYLIESGLRGSVLRQHATLRFLTDGDAASLNLAIEHLAEAATRTTPTLEALDSLRTLAPMLASTPRFGSLVLPFAKSKDPILVVEALEMLAESADALFRADFESGGSKPKGRAVKLDRPRSVPTSAPSRKPGSRASSRPMVQVAQPARTPRTGAPRTAVEPEWMTAAVDLAWTSMVHRSWSVRSAAYKFLSAGRRVESIPRMIARVDLEEGRMRFELLDALQAHTLRRHADRRTWRKWWEKSEAGFELPPYEAIAKPRTKRKPKAGKTVSYWGIPVVSERAAFVLDTSGSMNARWGTGGSRIGEAKRQLQQVLTEIGAQAELAVFTFSSAVDPVLGELVRMSTKRREKLFGVLNGIEPGGGTNVHDGLFAAFELKDVDTIYLLTDGQATEGAIRDANGLADAVAEWNRGRRIVIHCVALGGSNKLLRRLADESGGRYVQSR